MNDACTRKNLDILSIASLKGALQLTKGGKNSHIAGHELGVVVEPGPLRHVDHTGIAPLDPLGPAEDGDGASSVEEDRIEIFVEGIFDHRNPLPLFHEEEKLLGHDRPPSECALHDISGGNAQGHEHNDEKPETTVRSARSFTFKKPYEAEGKEGDEARSKGERGAREFYDLLKWVMSPIELMRDPRSREKEHDQKRYYPLKPVGELPQTFSRWEPPALEKHRE